MLVALAVWAAFALSAACLRLGRAGLPALLTSPVPLGLAVDGVLPFGLGVLACRLRVGGRAREGWARGLALARQEGWLRERPLGYALLVITLPVFFWSFTSWKLSIPPFTWDASLAALDTALHGGPPYRYLVVSFGLTRSLDRVYWSWHYVLLGMVLWQGWYGTAWERARFWLAFLLTWILLGAFLATIFASAGPVYYERVTGDPRPFGPLMAYLEAQPGLGLQKGIEGLWAVHAGGRFLMGTGISAFPSLHVGMAVLGICAAWPHRWLAAVFGLFTLAVLAGSVALGWHYAVDGYAAILLVPLIWWIAGRVR
jgi:PAP2 superfamily